MNIAETTRQERKALFQGMLKALKDERKDLIKRISEIDAELAEYGFGIEKQSEPKASVPKPAIKPPRAGSLKAVILEVVGNSPVNTAEVAAAVLEAGFKTKSKSYQQGVTLALSQLAKEGAVKKVKRGIWRAI